MPWTADRATNFGFSAMPTPDSWMPQPDGYGPLNQAAQLGVDGSTLTTYTNALALRRSLVDLASSDIEFVETSAPEIIAFRRGSIGVVLNMSSEPVANPLAGGQLLSSGGQSSADGTVTSNTVPANTTVWLRLA